MFSGLPLVPASRRHHQCPNGRSRHHHALQPLSHLVRPRRRRIRLGLLLYSTEGNRLRRYDIDTIGGTLVEDVLIKQRRRRPMRTAATATA